MNPWFYLLPVIGALTGWLIHTIAIRIFLYRWFPRQREEIGKKAGAIAQSEFFSLGIEQKISDPSNLQKAMPLIEGHVDDFLRNKLKEQMPMISMFIGDKTIQTLKEVFLNQLQILFPEVMNHFAGSMKTELNIAAIVAKKISTLQPATIHKAVRGELNRVILAGVITGFLTGLILLVFLVLVK